MGNTVDMVTIVTYSLHATYVSAGKLISQNLLAASSEISFSASASFLWKDVCHFNFFLLESHFFICFLWPTIHNIIMFGYSILYYLWIVLLFVLFPYYLPEPPSTHSMVSFMAFTKAAMFSSNLDSSSNTSHVYRDNWSFLEYNIQVYILVSRKMLWWKTVSCFHFFRFPAHNHGNRECITLGSYFICYFLICIFYSLSCVHQWEELFRFFQPYREYCLLGYIGQSQFILTVLRPDGVLTQQRYKYLVERNNSCNVRIIFCLFMYKCIHIYLYNVNN